MNLQEYDEYIDRKEEITKHRASEMTTENSNGGDNNNNNNTKKGNDRDCLPRFPLSKVKKIAKCDKDYIITSNAAIVATAFATELFVQCLVEEGLSMAHLQQGKKKSTNKNNMTKQAKLTLDDLIVCVERKEEYHFLEDVINKKNFVKVGGGVGDITQGIKKKVPENVASANKDQRTLPFDRPASSRGTTALEFIERDELSDGVDDVDNDAMDVDEEPAEDVLEGVVEEEEDTGEEEEHPDVDEELQREVENIHAVEDLDIDGTSDDEADQDDVEGDSTRHQLVGRAETVEEAESAADSD